MKVLNKYLIILCLWVTFCNKKKEKYYFKFQNIITGVPCPFINSYIGIIERGKSYIFPDVWFLTQDSLFFLSGRLVIQSDGKIFSEVVKVIKNLNPNSFCKELDTTGFSGEIKGKLERKVIKRFLFEYSIIH
jgi:hypothetical protein